ncbi:MAG: OsmC family protein [Candidatus Hodarchaeales archaeon]
MVQYSGETLHLEINAVWEKEKSGHFTTGLYKEKIPFSCPPEFGGNELPSPEDLFTSAIATCTLTTVLHLCDKLRTVPKSLEVKTKSLVEFDKDDGYKFTKIECFVKMSGDEFLLQRICELIPKYCLISQSIKPKIDYTFEIKGEE